MLPLVRWLEGGGGEDAEARATLTGKEAMTPGFRNRCVRGSRVRFREVRGTAASTAGEGPWGRTGMGCGPDTPHTAAPGGPGSRPGRVGACSRRGPDARLEPSPAQHSRISKPRPEPSEKRPRAPGGSRLPQRVLGRAGGRSPPSWHPTLPTREQGLTGRGPWTLGRGDGGDRANLGGGGHPNAFQGQPHRRQ